VTGTIVRDARVPTALLGVGGYLPVRVVDNAEVCERIDSSDAWIRKRSGIRTRHVAGPGESVVDMAEAASRTAIERAGIDVGGIGAVIVATITHPYQTPAAAPELAARLGSTAGAFDLSGACSGFCQAVAVADGLVQAGAAEHVLVVGADRLTDFLDRDERTCAFLFGDGAGAAVVGPSPDGLAGVGPVVWGSDGARRELVGITPSWLDCREDPGHRAFVGAPAWPVLTMSGLEVYKWAVYEVAGTIRAALAAAGVEPAALDAFVPHQANLRIIDDLVRVLDLPGSVAVARDVTTVANTSAASIPLALDRMICDGALKPGGLVLQAGFGAGLSYAAQVLRLPVHAHARGPAGAGAPR